MAFLSLERPMRLETRASEKYSLGDPSVMDDSSVAIQVTGWEFLMG